AGKPASYSEVLCAVVDLSVFFLYIPWRQDSGKSRRRYVWLARRWRSGPGPFRERRTGSRTSRESGATLLSFRWSGPRSWRGRNFLRRRKWPPTKRRFSSGPVARDRWRQDRSARTTISGGTQIPSAHRIFEPRLSWILGTGRSRHGRRKRRTEFRRSGRMPGNIRPTVRKIGRCTSDAWYFR